MADCVKVVTTITAVFTMRNKYIWHFQFQLSLFLFLILAVWITGIAASSGDEKKLQHTSQERNETEQAYNLFGITLSGEEEDSDNNHIDQKHVVIRNGKVQEHWVPISTIEKQNSEPLENLFHHGQYSDRITFDFFFGSFLTYEISTPTCSSSNSDVAKPKVIDFQTTEKEHSGSFTVLYDCQTPADANLLRNITISVLFPVVAGLSAPFSFRKTCGGGKHKYLEFGHYEESQYAAVEVSRIPFKETAGPFLAGPHVMSSKIYLHLYPPAKTQEFFHANVQSSDKALDLIPKGPIFGGVVRQSETAILHILYECHGKGKFNVSMVIPIHPFDNLNASWVKDCGGGVANGLGIGTTRRSTDVVREGVATEKWNFALRMNSDNISREIPVFNTSVRYKEFWLSNVGMPVRVSPAVISVEKPGMLGVVTLRSDVMGGVYKPEEGGLLPTDGRFRLRVRMICTKKGRSVIVITFPIKSFSNVEFGFVKECRSPRRYKHSGFLRTASSAMLTLSFLMTIPLLYWCRVQFDRDTTIKANSGYVAVPV